MKYNIISINDERLNYKERIRDRVHLEEVRIPAVNAYEVDVAQELKKRDLTIAYPGMFSGGEIGVWLSNFDCWQWAVDNDEELVVFEDDAIPHEEFATNFPIIIEELPVDYDFMCLWVPDNQRVDYIYDADFNDEGQPYNWRPHRTATTSVYDFGARHIAKVYNGYGNVAQLYSPKGAKFFLDRAREVGIYTPVDCYLYQEARAGRCSGFGPKPSRTYIVGYDWKAVTTVHKEDRV